MAIKLSFASAEEAPEGLREHLTEDNGAFVFEGESAKEIQGLTKALSTERQTNRDNEKRLKDFDAMRTQIDDLKSENKSLSEAGGDPEKWKAQQAQLVQQHESEKAEWQKKLEKVTNSALTDRRQREIAETVRSVKGLAGLDALIERNLSVAIENDQQVVTMTGADGQPLINSKGEYVSPTEYATGLRDTHPHLFEGSGAGGAGARFNQTGGRGSDAKDMTATQKIAAGLSKR